MDNIYKNIEQKNLIVFDDKIADILSNKTINPIVTKFFIRDRKLNISLAFITKACFPIPKNFRLNFTHY